MNISKEEYFKLPQPDRIEFLLREAIIDRTENLALTCYWIYISIIVNAAMILFSRLFTIYKFLNFSALVMFIFIMIVIVILMIMIVLAIKRNNLKREYFKVVARTSK